MRWLLWCFRLLAESYEIINHYHSSAPHYDSTHVKRNTISRTQLCRCRPHMNENSCTKVKTLHMKAKWFQRRILPWHRDKQAVDSQLLSSSYSYYKASFFKINHLPTDEWLWLIRFCGSLRTLCDVTITMLCNCYHTCNTMCSVDRIRTFPCTMQLTTARFRHQSTRVT